MPRKLRLHVTRQKCGNKWLYYHRVGKGPRTRLPDDPASHEFYEAWRQAEMAAPPPAKRGIAARSGTVRWLIDRYRESAAWSGLSAATRKQRDHLFGKILAVMADEPIHALDKAAIRRSMDKRAATPAQANVLLKTLRALFAWAVRNEIVAIDQTAGIAMLTYKTDGFAAWTIDDARAFCAAWPVGTMQRLAFEMGLVTGLRRSDMHLVGRQHLRGNLLSIRTTKTKTDVTIELPQRLLDIIAATPSRGLHFIESEDGKPYTVESFGNWFRKAAIKAGLKGKNIHGVRKLAATLSAEAGASSHEIMAQFGWASVKQAEHYTKGADRKRLGIKSSRLVAEQIENAMPQPKQSELGKVSKSKGKTTT